MWQALREIQFRTNSSAHVRILVLDRPPESYRSHYSDVCYWFARCAYVLTFIYIDRPAFDPGVQDSEFTMTECTFSLNV